MVRYAHVGVHPQMGPSLDMFQINDRIIFYRIDFHIKAVLQAPIVIVACAKKEKAGFFKGTPVTDKGDWMMFDVALALQNLTLAAYEKGLGTVHTGFLDALKVEKIINVPSDVAVIELLPIGYPEKEGKPTPRKQIEDFVFYESYGKKKG